MSQVTLPSATRTRVRRRMILATAVALLAASPLASAATVTKTAMPFGIAGFPGAGPGLGVHESLTPDAPDAVREVGAYDITVGATTPAEAPYAGATRAYAVDDVTNHTDTGVGYPMQLQLAEDAWAGEFPPDVARKLAWLLRNSDALIAGQADTARAAAAVQVVVWQTLRNPPLLQPRADLAIPTVDPQVNALAVTFTGLMEAGFETPPAAPGPAALAITTGPVVGCSATLTLSGTPGGVVTLSAGAGGTVSPSTVTLGTDGTGSATVSAAPGTSATASGTIAAAGVLVRADIPGPAMLDGHTTETHLTHAPEELIFIAGARATAVAAAIACPAPAVTPSPAAVPAVGLGQGLAPGSLVLTKIGATRARAGSIVTYRLRVRNTGTVAIDAVVLRDLVPAGLSLVSLPAAATAKNGVVSWRLGTLAPGQSRTIGLRLRVDRNATGRRCNAADASAANAPTVRARACTTIRRVAGAVRVPPAVTG